MSTLEQVLQKMGELGGALGRDGVSLPELQQAAAALSAVKLQAQHVAFPIEPSLEVIQPEPPPSVLPPALLGEWTLFEQFFAALNQRFGLLNRDQQIYVSEIAATLTMTPSGGPPSLVTTWQSFIDYLTQLTSMMGELNADQYLAVLDIAARLTSRGPVGGIVPGSLATAAPVIGDGTAANPLTLAPGTLAAGNISVTSITSMPAVTNVQDGLQFIINKLDPLDGGTF